jgi:hypothetical protein
MRQQMGKNGAMDVCRIGSTLIEAPTSEADRDFVGVTFRAQIGPVAAFREPSTPQATMHGTVQVTMQATMGSCACSGHGCLPVSSIGQGDDDGR